MIYGLERLESLERLDFFELSQSKKEKQHCCALFVEKCTLEFV